VESTQPPQVVEAHEESRRVVLGRMLGFDPKRFRTPDQGREEQGRRQYREFGKYERRRDLRRKILSGSSRITEDRAVQLL